MIEQALKERLTGAAVLVILGVLVIPVFLDGPPDAVPESTRMSLPVPPPRTDARPRQDAAGPTVTRPTAEVTVPEQSAPAGASVRQPPAQVETRPDADPEATDTRGLPGQTDPVSGWAVQVGSFSSQDNAERLRDQLKADGYRAFVMRHSESGRTLYRVRVGPEQERARAEALARRLGKNGQATAIVRHP